MIKSDRFSTNIFSERVIPLNQAINVRDMGGYETYDGRFVKWGLLYRGDHLMKLDNQDIALLEKMKVRTVIDYRSSHEQTVYPNKHIPGVEKVIQCDPKSTFSEAAANAVDLQSENVKLVNSLINGEVDPRFINDKGENVILGYKELITSETAKEAYRAFFQICADTENAPLIHHCRGGKDRTGIGAMFLLLALGVKEEDIIQDYIITGEIRKERNQVKYEQYLKLTNNKNYLDYLMTVLATRAEFIEAAITMVKEMYGTIEDYMIQHLGLTNEQLDNMRKYYLEEGVSCQAKGVSSG
jgi:protein-tyrosine phosphatase